MNKTTLIAAGSIIIVVIAGVGIMLLNQNKDPQTKTTNDALSKMTTESPSEDLGLCNIVSLDTIKSALGSAAANLTGPDNTGVIGLGDGDKGQTCVYPFVPGGTVSNGFYTDLAKYSSQESFEKVSSFTATQGTPISGLGDRATFEGAKDNYIGGMETALTVVKGTNVYIFAITEPKDATTFTDTTAQAALTKIAQAAQLK